MKRKFFDIYQYIAFLILFPLAYFLWKSVLNSTKLTIILLSLPILVSYIIPLIGTNITKFWEFNINKKVKNIRLYHGFVFGSATSLIGFLFYTISPNYCGIIEALIFAFVCASFIAFWNTFYDFKAVESEFIKINSKTSKEGKSNLETVCDYAPVYFYTLGFIYALFIKMIEYCVLFQTQYFYQLVFLFYASALTIPTLAYMIQHYFKYKTFKYWIR